MTVVAIAITTLLLADVLVRFGRDTLDSYYVDHYARKSRAVHARNPAPRVILLGSSRAAYGLAPSEFERATGLKAFNFGIPGSKIPEWQILAERTIASIRPSLVVLGVNASEIRADAEPISAARDLFEFRDLTDYLFHDGWSSTVLANFVERRLASPWALFHRRFEIASWLQERSGALFPKHAQLAVELRHHASRDCPEDGYEHPWLSGRRLADLEMKLSADLRSIAAATVPVCDVHAPVVSRFRALLQWFVDHDIPVVVAYLPNSPWTEERWHEAEPVLEQLILDCCLQAGVAYVGASTHDLPRTNADYLDESHMGLPLARRASRRIAERAIRLGLIRPDERLAFADERPASDVGIGPLADHGEKSEAGTP
ncbi:MAG: hypothetical protein KF841_13635 [Phycisphaerae bacterium]|nr:hypothetical protein [Phycisphaerae bacterium]